MVLSIFLPPGSAVIKSIIYLYLYLASQLTSYRLASISHSLDFDLQMKYNLPSWCDRVLWKSYPLVHVVCQSYGEQQVKRSQFPKLKGCSPSIYLNLAFKASLSWGSLERRRETGLELAQMSWEDTAASPVPPRVWAASGTGGKPGLTQELHGLPGRARFSHEGEGEEVGRFAGDISWHAEEGFVSSKWAGNWENKGGECPDSGSGGEL